MLYFTIRVFWAVLILLALKHIFIQEKEQLIGWKKTVVIVSAVLVYMSTAWLPVENLFVSFNSPEAVFKYCEFGSVYEAAEGRDSCLVTSKKSSGLQLAFYPKHNTGYKINMGINGILTYELIRKEEKGFISFMLYKYKNTGDYYLIISGSSEKEKHNITFNANDNTDFVGEKKRMYGPEQYDVYDIDKIFYISDLEELRDMMFDGEKVPISERVFTS